MKSIRAWVYVFAAAIGCAILSFSYFAERVDWLLGMSRLKLFGLAASAFLYLSLVPSPLYEIFPELPGRVIFQRAKKALGISAFFFALVYGALFGFMLSEGSMGLPASWNVKETMFLGTGLGAFFILAILAITSIKAIKQRIRPWWKMLHRFVYLAGGLSAIHLALFTSFSSQSHAVRVGSFVLIEGLWLIQLIRFDRFIRLHFPRLKRVIVCTLFPVGSVALFWLFFLID